jgi:adenylosuccinate synthase
MNRTILNVGASNGDEGKGTTVDFQTRETNSKLTVRFNGGAQAAHNIVLSDGRHHTFAQFGAATFNEGVKTYLSKYMLVNPMAMMKEEEFLRNSSVFDAFDRMYIDNTALVTTPYHRADNRLKELYRGSKMHGSCGMGISATVEDSLNRPDECLRMGDLLDDTLLLKKLKLNRLAMIESSKGFVIPNNALSDREVSTFDEELIEVIYNNYREFRTKVKIIEFDVAAKLFDETETVVFEPAQGILLDENYGFHPYTTWTTCTLKNAYSILSDLNYKNDIDSYLVTRTFATRHGPGPFVTEDRELTNKLADPFNTLNIWQRGFRCGWLDLVMLDYALRVNGPVGGLSVTHVDWLMEKLNVWKVCTKYTLDGKDWIPFVPNNMDEQIQLTAALERVIPVYEEVKNTDVLSRIEQTLKTKIKITSYGQKPEDKRWV